MDLKSKYDIGELVYVAQCETVTHQIECPECLGSRQWTFKTPAGNKITVDCPTCSVGYEVRGFIQNREYASSPKALTIGQIGYDKGPSDEMEFRYMCVETGIGSGSVWYESRLFQTFDDAYTAGVTLAEEMKSSIEAQNFKNRKRQEKEFKRRKVCHVCEGSGKVDI